MATIKDVAERAGVAISTVSRVINGKEGKCASEKVRAKIWKAVEELDYVANKSARNLKLSGGVEDRLVIHIYHSRQNLYSENSYFDDLEDTVKVECARKGIQIGEVIRLTELSDFMLNHKQIKKNEGLLVLGRAEKIPKELFAKFKDRIAFITLNSLHIPYDQILCDGSEATEIAMNFLFENGHIDIGYVGEVDDEVRFVGYKRNMIKRDIVIEKKWCYPCSMTFKGGYKSSNKIINTQKYPTALFCANDSVALGVLKGLQERGINVPNDISLISIDNISQASQVSPPLTTIEVPLADIGAFGVRTLIGKLNREHSVAVRIVLPVSLVRRESVKNIKKV